VLRRADSAVSRVLNVLFLCTGNSARSILAESLMNHWGKGRFRGFSAGSFPKGAVHPLALDLLRRLGLPNDGFRSKSWNEFAAPDAPPMNCVITVCDQAAGETCPVWPGHPIVAHWGVPDPAAVTGSEKERRQAFQDAFTALERRVKGLVDLPLEKLDRAAAERALRSIGCAARTTNGKSM
jgi:arsenate reductase (thioredoxin)